LYWSGFFTSTFSHFFLLFFFSFLCSGLNPASVTPSHTLLEVTNLPVAVLDNLLLWYQTRVALLARPDALRRPPSPPPATSVGAGSSANHDDANAEALVLEVMRRWGMAQQTIGMQKAELKKAELHKAEVQKADAQKAETQKAEAQKAEAQKAEAQKMEVQKADVEETARLDRALWALTAQQQYACFKIISNPFFV
jgi:hypothetical protein